MIKRTEILSLMKEIMQRQGRDPSLVEETKSIREIKFRSLDFSELCLRVETKIGKELNFEATDLRSIETVNDVCAFLEKTS